MAAITAPQLKRKGLPDMEDIKKAIIELLETANLVSLQIILSFVSGVCR